MNAQNLLLPDGTPSAVWFCSTCRTVESSQHLAEKCCTPALCETCGKEVETKYYTKCNACCKAAAREAARFEKAAKIPDSEYDGWVYLDGCGDDFFPSTQSLIEHLESDDDGEDIFTLPKYVWACTSEKVIDGSRLKHRLLDGIEAWDDFDPDKDLDGLPALQIALDAFAELNKEVLTYQPDFTRAIIVAQDAA